MLVPWTSYLTLALEAALLVNLARYGLLRVYRWFAAYLSADAIETAVGAIFQQDRRLFAHIYFAGQSVKVILAVMVVLELYRLALERHAALARYGRMTVAYVLGGAAVVAVLGLALEPGIAGDPSPVLRAFFSFERTISVWMLLFLLAIGAFMLWFPVVLKRNSALYIGGFVLYFLSRSTGMLAANLTPQWKQAISEAMLLVSVACLVVWLFALTEQGERVETTVGHLWDPAEARRLTAQLDAINAKLSRLSRS